MTKDDEVTKDEIASHASICAGLADAIQRGEQIDSSVLVAALTDAAAIIKHLIDKSEALDQEGVSMFAEAIRRGHRYVLLMTPRDGALRLRMSPSDMQKDEIMQMLREELNGTCEAAGCLSCPDCDPESFGATSGTKGA